MTTAGPVTTNANANANLPGPEFYDSIRAALRDPSSPTWFTDEFKPLLIANNHTFLATLLILTSVSSYPLKLVLELAMTTAVKSRNEDTSVIADSIRSLGQDSDELVTCIANISLSETGIAGGDLIKLHRLYSDVTNPPDIAVLRAADVMAPLLRDTFSPGHAMQHMSEKLFLVAHAAFSSDDHGTFDYGLLVVNRLDKLLTKVRSMSQITDNFAEFMALIDEPVCVTAILDWLQFMLFDDDFYEWTACSLATPPAFFLLDEVPNN